MAKPWADGIFVKDAALCSLVRLRNPVLLRFLTFCALHRVGNVAGTISGVELPDDDVDNTVSICAMEFGVDVYIFRAREPILMDAELDNMDTGEPSRSGTLNISVDCEELGEGVLECCPSTIVRRVDDGACCLTVRLCCLGLRKSL